MGGSVRYPAGIIFVLATFGVALLPGGVSALDLISSTPPPPGAAAPVTQSAEPVTQPVTQAAQPVTQAAQPVTQPVTQAAQPVQSVVGGTSQPAPATIQSAPVALQTAGTAQAAPAQLPAGEDISGLASGPAATGGGAGASNGSSISGGGAGGRGAAFDSAAADTPPPPLRGKFNVAADSSVAACQGDCSQSLCPALVPAPLAVGCNTASRLPALLGLGLASTGLPVLALLLGVLTFATGFVVTRRRRRVERPSD